MSSESKSCVLVCFFIFVTKEKSENKKNFLCHKGFELTVFGAIICHTAPYRYLKIIVLLEQQAHCRVAYCTTRCKLNFERLLSDMGYEWACVI